MGMIPKKTKSETKVFKGLTAQRFMGLFVIIILSSMIGSLIGGAMQWLFIACSITVYFILTGKSLTNPTQSFARGLINFIRFKFDNNYFIGSSNHDYIDYKQAQKEKNNERSKRKKDKESKEK